MHNAQNTREYSHYVSCVAQIVVRKNSEIHVYHYFQSTTITHPEKWHHFKRYEHNLWRCLMMRRTEYSDANRLKPMIFFKYVTTNYRDMKDFFGEYCALM